MNTRWPNIKFMEETLIILTIPSEYNDSQKAIMRDCIFQANLVIATKNSKRLQFITERKFIFTIYLK